mgnify:CR=1 FL=1
MLITVYKNIKKIKRGGYDVLDINIIQEDYDMEKKAKVAKLKAEIRNKFGYKVIEEVIDCEKEKDKYGKVVRRTYLRI